MNLLTSGDAYAKILPFILAVLLIFILPMLMRKYGWEPGDLVKIILTRFGKQDYAAEAKKTAGKEKKREPYQSNGRSSDLKSLVSTLLIFVRRNKYGLVYPGTVEYNGKTANLLALLVTREKVYGLNCFGFGGTIQKKQNGWIQHMNGADHSIPDPLLGNRQQYEIVRAMMDANGMKEIPLQVIAVFTSRTVVLALPQRDDLFDVEGLLQYLKEQAEQESSVIDPSATARALNEHVQRIRPAKWQR